MSPARPAGRRGPESAVWAAGPAPRKRPPRRVIRSRTVREALGRGEGRGSGGSIRCRRKRESGNGGVEAAVVPTTAGARSWPSPDLAFPSVQNGLAQWQLCF